MAAGKSTIDVEFGNRRENGSHGFFKGQRRCDVLSDLRQAEMQQVNIGITTAVEPRTCWTRPGLFSLQYVCFSCSLNVCQQ